MSEEDDADRPIGRANMAADGTLVLDLRPEGPGGLHGVHRIVLAPEHPEYQEWLDHLGGLSPGEEKLVPPWPDQPEGE
jgi:hypothetical protein